VLLLLLLLLLLLMPSAAGAHSVLVRGPCKNHFLSAK